MTSAGGRARDPAPGFPALRDRLDSARLRSLLQEAVRVYSPSYAEEPAAAVFEARLREAGLAVQRQEVAPRPGGCAGAWGGGSRRTGTQPWH